MDTAQTKQALIGQLRDLIAMIDMQHDPFLYYLPALLQTSELSDIDVGHAVTFTKLALKYDSAPMVKDALLILNRIVNPDDGRLLAPSPSCFSGNRSFFWNELGDHTNARDVIFHIFNKTIFFTSVGRIT
jgi:hypothetical protein